MICVQSRAHQCGETSDAWIHQLCRRVTLRLPLCYVETRLLGYRTWDRQHYHLATLMVASSMLVGYSCPRTSRKEVPRGGIEPGTM